MKRTDIKRQSAVKLSVNVQRFFLIFVVLSWLSTFATNLILMIGAPNISSQMWYYVGVQILLPLLYAIIAFVYANRHYRRWLHKLFVASFVALIGLLLYGILTTINTVWQIKFSTTDLIPAQGFWGQFGHELSIAVIALLVYTAALGIHDRRLSKK